MLTLVARKAVLDSHNIEELMAEADNIYNDHFMPSDRRELIETGVKLAGLKEDFAELKQMIQQGTDRSALTMRELDTRIRALENFRWWIAGAAAASGLAAGFVSRFFHP